ncbi:4048_t:CDS:2, partial [Gigaspora margarita]
DEPQIEKEDLKVEFDDVFEGFRNICEMEAEIKPLSDDKIKTNLRKLKNCLAQGHPCYIPTEELERSQITYATQVSDKIREMCEKYVENFSEDTSEILLKVIVSVLRALLKNLLIGKSGFITTAKRESLASKNKKGKYGKKPDIMFILKYKKKKYELMYGECSQLVCNEQKEEMDRAKLWREINDGMFWVHKGCSPTKEEFGIVGIQIPELEKKFAEVEAENAKLKQIIEKNAMRDASFAVDGQTQNVDRQNNTDTKSIEGVTKVSDEEIDDFVPEESIPKVSPVNLPQPCKRYPKSLKEKKIDSFLDSENKKMVRNLMRERNREKKLRTQESLVMSPTSSKEESSVLEEASIYNSHGIEKEKQNEISMEHLANPTDMDEYQKVISVTKSNAYMIKSSEVSIPIAPNSLGDSKVIGPDNSPKANDYNNPMPSSMEKGTNEVQTDYDNDCSHDNDSEENVSFSDNER